jgi:ATP-dependent helicase/nuclease subunit A
MTRPASTLNLNAGQRAALDLHRDMIVSAGAGAGKTQVLGLRVLALLEEGLANVDQVVAFTFTDKAAAEMRERVQRLLMDRITELEASRDKQRLPQLKQAQAEFSRNRISTVHSFCYRLLKEYAWEAEVEPRAAILDERRQASARDAAIRNVLLRADLSGDATLGGALARLGAAMSFRELGAAIAKLLRERNVLGPALQLAAQQWAEPDVETRRRRDAHAALLADALGPVVETLSTIDVAAVTRAVAGDKLREPALELVQLCRQPDAQRLAEILLTKDMRKARSPGGAAGKWKHDPDALEHTRQAFGAAGEAMLSVVERVPLTFDEVFERRAGAVLRDLWAVFERAQEAYTDACAGGLDFLDLELRSIRLLRERPDVCDELVRRFRYLLVDEFQDTNPVQAELFELLTRGDSTPGRFFAVGDAKQSVYGFRGSDVSIFNRALVEVPARNAVSGAGARAMQPAWSLECDDTPEQRNGIVRLEHNYRTVEPLLALGNRVFRNIFTVEQPRPFDAQSQDMIAGGVNVPVPLTPVELHLLAKPGREDEDARRDDEAELVAQRVERLHESGVAFSEIAILVRRSTRNHEYRNAFARHNLPLLVVGESGLWETQEGLDCLNLLRVLANPFDDIAMLGLLRSPFAGLSDRYLTELALRADREAPLLMRLQQDTHAPRQAREFLARFEALRMRAGKEPPALLLNEALSASAYALAVGCGFDAEQRLANVERAAEIVRQMQREFPCLATLVRELLNRVESGDTEAQGAPDAGAEGVRLLTAHKSKGLEFPVVIVPDLAGGGGGNYGVLRSRPAESDHPLGIWLRATDEESLGDSQCDLYGHLAAHAERERAAAEEKRVLYVAWTRARARLILVGTVADEFENQTWAHQLLRALRVGARGDPSAEPALELTWHDKIERAEPIPHTPAAAAARQALEAGQLRLPATPDTSLLAPARPAEDLFVAPEAAEFGTLVHAALERRIRAAGAELGAVNAADLGKHVSRATEALASLGKARRELPEFGLITPDGARRLDLLREMDDGVYEIVDYKTDRLEDDAATHAEREHGAQLREYAAALHAMLAARGKPPKAVRTYVCFTAPDGLNARQRLVEISR